MTRDEVIWSLERCTRGVPGTCRDCKAFDTREAEGGDCIVCMEQLMRDALSLLKAKPKRGRWIKTPGYFTPGGDPVWRCSECGKGIHVYGIEHGFYGVDVSDGQWVACPNCGAPMEGEDTE